ncbi:hypothetical protein TWF506_011256 [Arthrobotrys conoides]|uniref:Uncharacterized protein n=1 Tax=Arthrobotrys conoides TaxID=74498 RepID=A0AAN8PAP0_9PEZI
MPLTPTMPPARNSTLRTERTHEENQERAYIAASHRTDRSLEARMESARRASEIHKQRTGKFFKITEKAVLAGEVYMDDDDEIPAPYYQLDQQLKPDAPNREEFFKRFIDYLTVNVNLRRRLELAIGEAKIQSASKADAAAAPKRGPPSTSPGFQEGPALEQGQSSSTGIQVSPFLSSVFVPPHQGQLKSTTSESSNPPTPTMVTHTHPQVSTEQFQPPISANGTQFHVGPVGLGTLPPHYFEGTYLGRRQTVPTIKMPQQLSSPSASALMAGVPQNPYYSAVLTPEQYQALSQTLSASRPSASTAEAVGSPMSDLSMASFRTPLNSTMQSASSGSPDHLSMRRPSASSRISESPLRASTFSPHLKQQQQFPTNSEGFNTNTNPNIRRQTPGIMTHDLNSPIVSVVSTPREGNRSIPQSPAAKRRATTDMRGEERTTKSSKTDDSPSTTAYSPAQSQSVQAPTLDTDFGLFDFSLPQNFKDILFGPGMFMPGDAALSFAGITAEDFDATGIAVTCPTDTSSITTMPAYNMPDSQLDQNNSPQNPPPNPPVTFNMNFSKQDNSPFENFEELWRKYFLERGIQPHTANTGYPGGTDPGGPFPS